MDESKKEYFRNLLNELKDELEQLLDNTQDSTKPVSPDSSIGRLTRLDAIQSQQMNFEAERRYKKRLKMIKKALELVEDGSYGYCVKCGEEIPEGRLESMPEARVCVNCARQ